MHESWYLLYGVVSKVYLLAESLLPVLAVVQGARGVGGAILVHKLHRYISCELSMETHNLQK